MSDVRASEPYTGAPPFPWRRVGVVVAVLAAVAGTIVGLRFALVRTTQCGFGPDEEAMFLLLEISQAQGRYRTVAAVDEDADGVPEFGGLAELAGLVDPRGRASSLVEPPLDGWLGAQDPDGSFADPKQRYRFLAVMRARDGRPVAELPGVGFPAGTLDPDAAETTWLCYAWPADPDFDDLPTFVLDASGTILRTDEHAYRGPVAPAHDAAVAATAPAGALDPLSHGDAARDGNVWRRVR